MRALIEGKDFWLKTPGLSEFSFTRATGTERDGSETNRSQCKTLFGLFAPL